MTASGQPSAEHDRRQAARTAEWLNSPSRTLMDLQAARQVIVCLEADGGDISLPIAALGWLAAVRRMVVRADEGRVTAQSEASRRG